MKECACFLFICCENVLSELDKNREHMMKPDCDGASSLIGGVTKVKVSNTGQMNQEKQEKTDIPNVAVVCKRMGGDARGVMRQRG